MIVIALALALSASSASTAQDQERASDTGRTLQSVDALRARGEYDRAALELRGWLSRWEVGLSLDSPSFMEEAARMQALMKKMVEMEGLMQEALEDESAARRYLQHLVEPTKPTTRTAEQAMALKLLARHDPDVMELLNSAFPARLVVEVDSPLVDENVIAFPLESALAEVSRHALPVGRGPGASELRVRLTMFENDRSSSILAGTAMRSYAMQMSAEIVGADGESIVRAATTTAVLGINPGNGAKYGMPKCAQLIYQQLVDELAKRAAASGT